MNAILLENKYRYSENDLIGTGGFGKVYKGIDLSKNIEIAIKIDEKNKYLKKESNIYDIIKDGKFMAKKIDYFEKDDISYLIMPLHYKSAEELFREDKNVYFNDKDIMMLGIQIVQQLNHLHKKGILHLDIKPDNFILNKDINKFYLIDFGLSRSYLKDGKHIQQKKNSNRCGTLKFMSINCHERITMSRRDDLISLSFSLIYLHLKSLPWKTNKYKFEKKDICYEKIMDKKKKFLENIDTFGLPAPLTFLINYAHSLKFNKTPDYSFIIKGFYNYLKLNNNRYDGKWTWDLGKT